MADSQSTAAPITQQPVVEYREIEGFPGYRVGSDGTIIGPRKRLRPSARPNYMGVTLSRAGCGSRFHSRFVHLLVLEAFHGQHPEGCQARHLDGNRLNNAANNLAWGTPKENGQDKVLHGTSLRGEIHNCAKLTEEQAREIKFGSLSHSDAAEKFGVSIKTVKNIRSGGSWRWLCG